MVMTRTSRSAPLLAALVGATLAACDGGKGGAAEVTKNHEFFVSPLRGESLPVSSEPRASKSAPPVSLDPVQQSAWCVPNPLLATFDPLDGRRLVLDLPPYFEPEDLPSVLVKYEGQPWSLAFRFRVEDIPWDTNYFVGLRSASAALESEQSLGLLFVTGGGGSGQFLQIDRFWAIHDRTDPQNWKRFEVHEETRARRFSFWERTVYEARIDWDPASQTVSVQVDYPDEGAEGEPLARSGDTFLPYVASWRTDLPLEPGDYELGVWSYRRRESEFEQGPMHGEVELWELRTGGLLLIEPRSTRSTRAQVILEVAKAGASDSTRGEGTTDPAWRTYCILRNVLATHAEHGDSGELLLRPALRDTVEFHEVLSRLLRAPQTLTASARTVLFQPPQMAEDLAAIERILRADGLGSRSEGPLGEAGRADHLEPRAGRREYPCPDELARGMARGHRGLRRTPRRGADARRRGPGPPGALPRGTRVWRRPREGQTAPARCSAPGPLPPPLPPARR